MEITLILFYYMHNTHYELFKENRPIITIGLIMVIVDGKLKTENQKKDTRGVCGEDVRRKLNTYLLVKYGK